VWFRVSTAGQTIDSQREPVLGYCKLRGWDVVQQFEEHGVSGSAPRRATVENILAGFDAFPTTLEVLPTPR
jgi:hypothetical protein